MSLDTRSRCAYWQRPASRQHYVNSPRALPANLPLAFTVSEATGQALNL